MRRRTTPDGRGGMSDEEWDEALKHFGCSYQEWDREQGRTVHTIQTALEAAKR